MKHLKAINRKAERIADHLREAESVTVGEGDVYAMQDRQASRPHYPVGCAIVFSPGWEVDSAGGTAGLCQPAERDLYDCYVTCYWPAQVPDHYNNYPDWTAKCAAATKDWRDIELVFP